jgi:6-phosphogluconolactonase (cycloisomerase 2 family)
MGREHPADGVAAIGQDLLACIGRRLIRYYPHDAGFTEQESVEMPLSVQYACFHPDRAVVYVACSNGGVGTPGDRHCLAQVELGETGMTVLKAPIALPYRPLHASVDPRQNRLVLAYNRPAAVTVHDLDAPGFVQGRGFLVEGGDVVGYFPHQIIPMPGGQDFLLSCRGDDASTSNKENPGSLRVLRYDGLRMACKQAVAPNGGLGFGPRNCAFHPHRDVLYAVLERQNRLAVFGYRDGVIEPQPRWTVNLLKNTDTARRPQLGGAIVIVPSGRFAYVVNRAHPVSDNPGMAAPCGENSIVVFELDDLTGEPRELQRVALHGLHARCIALSRDGAFLVAALRQAGRYLHDDGSVVECSAGFATFRVGDSGHLTFMHQDVVDVRHEQLFWADFAPFRNSSALHLTKHSSAVKP